MISADEKLAHVSEDGIRQLVDAFYAKVRINPELAPIFARAIPGDWQPHLTKMYAFWSSVMLTTGRYKGNPVSKHLWKIKDVQLNVADNLLTIRGEKINQREE